MKLVRSTAARGVVPCLMLLTLAVSSCVSSPDAKSARFLEAGKKLLKNKDASRAILQFQNAVKATPRNAEAYYQLATAFLAAGDAVHGVASLRKSLELNPKQQAAQLLMAQVMVSTNEKDYLQDAQKRLQALLQDAPDNPDALHALALTKLKLGEPADAVRDLGQAMTAAPQSLLISVTLAQVKVQQGDLKSAEEVLQQACRNSPKSVAAVVVLGKLYSAENRPAEAEREFRQALAMDGNDTGALFSLGLLQNQTGKKQDAEQTFRKLSRMPDKRMQGSLAAFLNQEGRQDEALQELTRLAREDPADRAVRTWLVNGYLAANRTAEVAKLLNDALKKNPKDLDALLQRGEIALAARNFNQAEADLNQVLHLEAASPQVHYVLGKLYLARKEDLRYRQELSEALKLNPGLQSVRVELAQTLVKRNEGRAALELLDAAPEAQKSSPPVLVQRNWALWTLGNLPEMRQGIDRGLAQERSPDLLVQDGLWKLRAGDVKSARAVLGEALKIDPSDLAALQVLNGTYVAEKNGTMAIQKVKEYAALQPKSAPIQDFLGIMLLGSGDRAQARMAFTAAKAADPQFVKADLSLAQVDILEGKLSDARKRLESVVSSNGNDLTARLWLGDIAEKEGDHKTAIEQFRKVVEANTRDAQASNNLAYLLTEYGNDPDEALKHAERAVELAPERPAYCDTLGWALYHKGLYSSAIPYLQRASANPQSVVWKYHLAMAYARAGDLKRGRTTLEAALKLAPNLPEARMAEQMMGASR
jgi:tetratricopeptide (TPR) repeat protein